MFGRESGEEPLNYGEHLAVAELLVTAMEYEAGEEQELASPLELACHNNDLLQVIDAEGDLVCWVPREKADLLVRLLNSYQFVVDGERRSD